MKITAWLTLLGAFLWCGAAAAQTPIVIPCPNGPPCEQQIYGHIDAIGTVRKPWVATVVVPAGVSLSVYSYLPTAFDARKGKMTLIGPSGEIHRDVADVTAPGTVATTASPTKEGWYTIEVDSPPPAGEQLFRVTIAINRR